MPRHSYREHDYTFGQTMLRLRKSLRLTQAGLAQQLGVSRRAVGEWEGGLNYPREHHLQHVIELCVQQHVFAPKREEEEIRALWETGHQRVFLDEAWLSALLDMYTTPVFTSEVRATSNQATAMQSATFPRIDWV